MSDADLWSDQTTKIALRRSYREILPDLLTQAPKRALRAPGRIWHEHGASGLAVLAERGEDLLACLGLRHEGVEAVAKGCRNQDPGAIPFAVALLTTCLPGRSRRERPPRRPHLVARGAEIHLTEATSPLAPSRMPDATISDRTSACAVDPDDKHESSYVAGDSLLAERLQWFRCARRGRLGPR